MFIHFLCLCPLRLAIMLNFNILKVAYSTKCSFKIFSNLLSHHANKSHGAIV